MHQWWGDNVSESNYNMTFFKEGMATLAEYYYAARQAELAAGGLDPGRRRRLRGEPGRPVRQQLRPHLAVHRRALRSDRGVAVPGSSTYTRPGTAYLALRRIMGASAFNRAGQAIQRTYGGKTITEPQLEAAFSEYLPDQSGPCTSKLSRFFTQWFDTAYPSHGRTRPSITGANFYRKNGHGCA